MITVLIPTYNRKTRLARTLNSLEQQSNSNFNVVISDNASDYDINDLLENHSMEFRDRVVVSRNPVNVGLGGNIALSLLKCKSDWAWLVSDDDIIEIDAIQKIYDAILKYPDCAWMNFEIYQNSEGEREIIGLMDYVEYLFECRSKYHYLTTADLIFMSNKVFHLAIIKDYISLAVEYAYSYIPHVFILLKSLEENRKAVILHDKIVGYDAPSQSDPKYSVKIAYSRMRSIVDCDFDIPENYRQKLYAVTTPDYKNVLSVNILAPFREHDRKMLNLYYDCLSMYYSTKEKVIFKVCAKIDSFESGHKFLNKILKKRITSKQI